jgi:hypothetical protein
MKKAFLAAVAALAIAGASVVTSNDAHAQRRGGAVAAGLIGGIAAGAIIGGAIANSRPAYGGPVYYAEPAPVYVAPRGPRCYWARGERFWDSYEGRWRRERVRVCD